MWEGDLRIVHQDTLRSRGFVGSTTRWCRSSNCFLLEDKIYIFPCLFLYGETFEIHRRTEPAGESSEF